MRQICQGYDSALSPRLTGNAGLLNPCSTSTTVARREILVPILSFAGDGGDRISAGLGPYTPALANLFRSWFEIPRILAA